MKNFFDRLIAGCKDFLYPDLCLVCKEKLSGSCAESPVCPRCWHSVKRNTPPFCIRCGRSLHAHASAKNACDDCQKQTFSFDRAYAPCAYEGTVKELLHAFKFGLKDYLGRQLAGLMSDFIREYGVPIDLIDVVIPVPLHAARKRQREFNQAEVLSRYLAADFAKKTETHALVRTRNTKAQAKLASGQRIQNVTRSFSVWDSAAVRGKNILLVDDILTTGLTASEAAGALKSAGANVVLVLTVAN